MNAAQRPIHVLFVFAWLVVGGEETEVRLLARNLDRRRYSIEVTACLRKPNMPEQSHSQLRELGIPVDCTPYALSFEDTVEYLSRKMADYDLIVGCQAVPDVYPALERMTSRPPLIEHGGLVSETLAGPKHFTSRYVGVCRVIRDAAASTMPERPHHAIEIPSMVDLAEFREDFRSEVRAEWGINDEIAVIGWAGRLDRKKRVEDFIAAAALVHRQAARVRFVIIGGPDAFMPEYAEELRELAIDMGVGQIVQFLGDRSDMPRLLAGLDVFTWLSRGEGMPHVISEAGAARVAIIATRDNGSEEQITPDETGVFVPHEDPPAIASAVLSLLRDPAKRRRLGEALRRKVEREYSAAVVIPQWKALFDEVIAEAR